MEPGQTCQAFNVGSTMDIDVEVQRVVDAKSRVVWEARPLHTEHLTLQLRHLMWLEKARPLVTECV